MEDSVVSDARLPCEECTTELRFVDVSASNLDDALQMYIPKKQRKYAAHPVESIALAYCDRELHPQLVYMLCHDGPFAAEYILVGFVMWKRTDKTLRIRSLVVDFNRQRQGYGRRILQEMFDTCGEGEQLTLSVHYENTPAISLYKSLGFKVQGLQREHWECVKS